VRAVGSVQLITARSAGTSSRVLQASPDHPCYAPAACCAFHLFVGSASRCAPQVFMMQSTDARHLHHSPLARQLHTARLGCVFTQ